MLHVEAYDSKKVKEVKKKQTKRFVSRQDTVELNILASTIRQQLIRTIRKKLLDLSLAAFLKIIVTRRV